MRHSVVMILFASNTMLFAAGPPDLLVAIRNGYHSQVRNLIEAGGDVNTVDNDGTTALMHSVIESDVKMMKLLIDKGAHVNMKNALDSTALVYATTNLAKTRVLLDAGAEVKVKGKRGATPMSVAVTTFGSTPVLKLLVNKGAELENRLMTLAAGTGDLEAIQYLLSIGVPAGDRTGAALESTDRERFTLLMQAVLSMEPRRDQMVEWLLSKGADPNAKNDRGDTAYVLAARVGIRSTLKLLVKAGAKEVDEQWPKPAGGALSVDAAVKKVIPLIEMSGEPGWKARRCVSCHSNSLPQMAVALARKKGFPVNEEQAKKELGF